MWAVCVQSDESVHGVHVLVSKKFIRETFKLHGHRLQPVDCDVRVDHVSHHEDCLLLI